MYNCKLKLLSVIKSQPNLPNNISLGKSTHDIDEEFLNKQVGIAISTLPLSVLNDVSSEINLELDCKGVNVNLNNLNAMLANICSEYSITYTLINSLSAILSEKNTLKVNETMTTLSELFYTTTKPLKLKRGKMVEKLKADCMTIIETGETLILDFYRYDVHDETSKSDIFFLHYQVHNLLCYLTSLAKSKIEFIGFGENQQFFNYMLNHYTLPLKDFYTKINENNYDLDLLSFADWFKEKYPQNLLMVYYNLTLNVNQSRLVNETFKLACTNQSVNNMYYCYLKEVTSTHAVVVTFEIDKKINFDWTKPLNELEYSCSIIPKKEIQISLDDLLHCRVSLHALECCRQFDILVNILKVTPLEDFNPNLILDRTNDYDFHNNYSIVVSLYRNKYRKFIQEYMTIKFEERKLKNGFK